MVGYRVTSAHDMSDCRLENFPCDSRSRQSVLDALIKHRCQSTVALGKSSAPQAALLFGEIVRVDTTEFERSHGSNADFVLDHELREQSAINENNPCVNVANIRTRFGRVIGRRDEDAFFRSLSL